MPASAQSDVLGQQPRPFSADRYRVLERRDVRQAVEFEFALISACIAVELVLIGPGNGAFAAVSLAALLALGCMVVGWRLGMRRHPHPTAFAIGVVVFAMGIGAASTTVVIASLMDGMFAVVVVGCAIWMPWSPRWHTAFLALAVVALVVGLAIAPLGAVEHTTGLVVGACAVGTSGVGMWLARRRSLRAWRTTLELRRREVVLRRTVHELEEAQRRVRRLEGILPICAACKRIRDGEHWYPVEGYVSARTDAQFSHGICPTCADRLYPEDGAEAESA